MSGAPRGSHAAARRADATCSGAGFSDWRDYQRRPGNRHGLSHGTRPALGARPRPDRGGGQGRSPGNHRHRAPVSGQQGAADRAHRAAGAGEADRGNCLGRPAGRVRQGWHAHRHRAQAGRGDGDRAEQSVCADADGERLRHQHGCAAGRSAQADVAEGNAGGVHPASTRSRHATHDLRSGQGARARPYPRRPCHCPCQHRRRDCAHQGRAIPARGAHRAARPCLVPRYRAGAAGPRRRDFHAAERARSGSRDERRRLSAFRRAGTGHPRHAPKPADRARAG